MYILYICIYAYKFSVCFLSPHSTFIYINAFKMLYRKKESNTVSGEIF